MRDLKKNQMRFPNNSIVKSCLRIVPIVIGIAVGMSTLSISFQSNAITKEKWQSLFNGKSLKGWHALPGGSWSVEDGILVGTSEPKEERHGILVSDSEYKNFEIEVVFKAMKGNSGLYFRVDETGDMYGVAGFQAEIHPEEYVGGLYETGGRGWVSQPNPEHVRKYNKAGDWNTMRVHAVDGDITVTVNGATTAVLQNDPSRKQGHFGLQLHGGQEMLVMFKVIRIREL